MKNIYKALAEFQYEVPVIHKGTQGFGYSYSSLTEIFQVILPLLKKHGLGFTQLMQGTALKTIIFHVESGESIESIAEIPQNVTLAKMNQYQVIGSAITYFRRYALSAALGLITDADTDVAGKQIPQKLDPHNNPRYEKAIQALAQDKTTIAQIMKVFDISEQDIIDDLDMIR